VRERDRALLVARRYCEVAGIDYVSALMDRSRQRAQAEGLVVDFRVADVQALPFPDESFDAVVSVYGVQFAPDQEQADKELLRVRARSGTGGQGASARLSPWWTHRSRQPDAARVGVMTSSARTANMHFFHGYFGACRLWTARAPQ
jgi:ubiquinone/menaquinone biosynthesis C-methylase UbiE